MRFGVVAPTADQLGGGRLTLEIGGVQHLRLRFWTSASDLTEDGLVEQLTRFATEVMPGAGTDR